MIDCIRMRRFPTNGDPDIKYFVNKAEQLSVEDGCLLWGNRVVIPKTLRGKVLEELYQAHPGINRIKGLARSYVWWPNMDNELERLVEHCHMCQAHQNMPHKAPIHPWEWARNPWQRVHIDYADLNGKNYLIIIDAYSKWLEVIPTVDVMRM